MLPLSLVLAMPLTAEEPQKPSAETADTSNATMTKVSEIEGISEYRLDNGTRVLLFPDESKEKVTVNMTVFVGSRHEGYGEAGMAHLLEHMLFKGTPQHPEVPKVLQDRGAIFNGTTWNDRTNYYETLPASDENLEFAIRLEADRLVNSYVRGEDLASEMTVVRNEFERGENSPTRILMQRITSSAYEWHNYAKSTIGNRSDIERVPVVRLRQFYRKFYRPDNVMVVVAGKFDEKNALQYLQKYFGALDSPDTPIDETYTILRRFGGVG
ncbi:MAG: pitrilysin family protein, partial [Planctomycetota bacterium]